MKSEERSLAKNEEKGRYLRGLESDDSNKIVILKRWRANLLGLPGECTHRDEVVLTWLQDAEEKEKESPSPPGGPGLYLRCL